MALNDENGGIPATMLVAPTGGAAMPYYGQGGSGGWDQGNGWWIILLFILLASGNWGGQNGFGGNAPMIINDGNGGVQRGFDQAAIMGGLGGIQSGIQNLSTQLCGCCCDMQMALANGFAGVEQGANARQIANMQQAFAAQTAQAQGFNALQTAANDLRYTVATENCADRAALSDGVRDILASQSAGIQRILDQMCNDKIDAKNERIADLERQLTMANLAASQGAQTARILADNAAQTTALEQYLAPTPRPAYIVQNPNCCPQNNCGCGC